jgi:hypothetical protein
MTVRRSSADMPSAEACRHPLNTVGQAAASIAKPQCRETPMPESTEQPRRTSADQIRRRALGLVPGWSAAAPVPPERELLGLIFPESLRGVTVTQILHQLREAQTRRRRAGLL